MRSKWRGRSQKVQEAWAGPFRGSPTSCQTSSSFSVQHKILLNIQISIIVILHTYQKFSSPNCMRTHLQSSSSWWGCGKGKEPIAAAPLREALLGNLSPAHRCYASPTEYHTPQNFSLHFQPEKYRFKFCSLNSAVSGDFIWLFSYIYSAQHIWDHPVLKNEYFYLFLNEYG